MDELKLSIELLRRRAIDVRNTKLLKKQVKVIPLLEVEAILSMIMHGEFKNWYDKMKSERHPDYI